MSVAANRRITVIVSVFVIGAALVYLVLAGAGGGDRGEPLPSNVALGKPVTADSVYDDRYPPHNAVDGDHEHIGSRWLSARTNTLDWTTTPHWIEIDLLDTCGIVGMRFWSGAENEYKWPPDSFRLQRLQDGDWVDVFAESGNRAAVYTKHFPVVSARKFRLYATRGTDIGALRLYEIELLGYC